jgi:hypothetical protein
MIRFCTVLLYAAVLIAVPASSRSSGTKCTACVRNRRGRIKRNPAAKRAFQQKNPCPATGMTSGACHGYVVDHIVPLKRGGSDSPANMQWQTKAEAKAKDRIE